MPCLAWLSQIWSRYVSRNHLRFAELGTRFGTRFRGSASDDLDSGPLKLERGGDTIQGPMNAPATTTVEFDSDLLKRLRERTPGKSAREALERVARIQLGFDTIRRVQERNAAAGVDDDDVMAEAVRAVRESRKDRAARRAAG